MIASVVLTLLAAALFLFALNGRLRARKIVVWQLGLLASEFGIFFAPAGVVIAIFAFREGIPGLPALLLATGATGLFLYPEYASWKLGRGLAKRIREKVGRADPYPPRQDGIRIPVMSPGGRTGRFQFRRPDGDGGQGSARPTFHYRSPSGQNRRIVFYPANNAKPAPCVVVVHSGGWESGSPEEFPGFHRLLAKSGYAVAAVEYALAPEHAWPAPREDVRAAIAWLRDNAEKLRIDPDRLVLFGRSAGGQIALCVAYDDPPPGVRGVISFYAPTDMVFAWRGAYDGDILDSPKLLKNYVGGRPHETPERHADASPGVHAKTGPQLPTLLLHGRRDELVWFFQLRRLARILRKTGTPHVALVLPWARHAFDYRTRGPGGRIALRAVTTFLESVA